MNRLFAMIFVIAGLAISFPPPAHAQEEPVEIEESGPRLSAEEARRILRRRNSRQALRASSRSSTT